MLAPTKKQFQEHQRLLNSVAALDNVIAQQARNRERLKETRLALINKRNEIDEMRDKFLSEFVDLEKLTAIRHRLSRYILEDDQKRAMFPETEAEGRSTDARKQLNQAFGEGYRLLMDKRYLVKRRDTLGWRLYELKEDQAKLDVLYQELFKNASQEYPEQEKAHQSFVLAYQNFHNGETALNNECTALAKLSKAQEALIGCLSHLRSAHDSLIKSQSKDYPFQHKVCQTAACASLAMASHSASQFRGLWEGATRRIGAADVPPYDSKIFEFGVLPGRLNATDETKVTVTMGAHADVIANSIQHIGALYQQLDTWIKQIGPNRVQVARKQFEDLVKELATRRASVVQMRGEIISSLAKSTKANETTDSESVAKDDPLLGSLNASEPETVAPSDMDETKMFLQAVEEEEEEEEEEKSPDGWPTVDMLVSALLTGPEAISNHQTKSVSE